MSVLNPTTEELRRKFMDSIMDKVKKPDPTTEIIIPTVTVEGKEVDMKTFGIIMNGHLCPYCHGKTEYVDSAPVYSKSYRMLYYCQPCHAWVGCHKGNDQALGRLAKADLRDAKINAHAAFDQLWVRKSKKPGWDKKRARTAAYGWLAKEMGLPTHLTHMGMMDVTQCMKVIEVCKPWI